MTSLQSRVERLEQQQTGAQSNCELCARVETRVIMPRADGEPMQESDSEPVAMNCPRCGQQREFVTRVITPRPPEGDAMVKL